MSPAIYAALQEIEPFFGPRSKELVVTSVLDGAHRVGSLHYTGNAADIRTRSLAPEDRRELESFAREVLGDAYDVVLESDHLHIEFQPKSPWT